MDCSARGNRAAGAGKSAPRRVITSHDYVTALRGGGGSMSGEHAPASAVRHTHGGAGLSRGDDVKRWAGLDFCHAPSVGRKGAGRSGGWAGIGACRLPRVAPPPVLSPLHVPSLPSALSPSVLRSCRRLPPLLSPPPRSAAAPAAVPPPQLSSLPPPPPRPAGKDPNSRLRTSFIPMDPRRDQSGARHQPAWGWGGGGDPDPPLRGADGAQQMILSSGSCT